jgi:PTH1 family peptidyl-tRNA hydrolase
VALRRSKDEGRRGSPSSLVIVGLANPGDEYAGTRHNVGGEAVRLVATRRGATFSLERRQRASTVTLTTSQGPVTLAIPTTFMNESGAALAPLLRRTSLDDLSRLVVAHDELDLEPGRLQLKLGGGLAGHNGLRSIAKPVRKEQGADYVLQHLSGTRKAEHARDVEAAADALELLLDHDFDEAQRRVNGARG